MVHIDRIYTRSGDTGKTGLADGSRVSKLDPRIGVGGSVDETNSCLGVAASHCDVEDVRNLLHSIQQQLFDLGADLSFPWPNEDEGGSIPRIASDHVEWLENQIDKFNDGMQPLKSFVLPGGSKLSAALHVARSVCRRAEVDALRLAEEASVNPQLTVYLNRLSDLYCSFSPGMQTIKGDKVMCFGSLEQSTAGTTTDRLDWLLGRGRTQTLWI